jgi:hypothetical protein
MISNSEQPTLAELRARVQKGRHREIGNWLARRVARPSAVYGTWLAVRLGLSAHQVTSASLIASIGASLAIATGMRPGFVVGVGLLHLAFWLDHVDGQVARWRGTASLDGVYFDYLMHHLANMALGFALGFGLAVSLGEMRWAVAGFSIAWGWVLLSLHNDCRYKAMFQRLKSANATFLVEGGSGGRPAPAASWPRRGLGMLTWPAFKACEPHVVLLVLTGIAAIALFAPVAWSWCWRIEVAALAVATPVLGLGRMARSVVRSGVETEFHRWFRKIEDTEGGLQTTLSLDQPGCSPARRPLDTARPDVVSTS